MTRRAVRASSWLFTHPRQIFLTIGWLCVGLALCMFLLAMSSEVIPAALVGWLHSVSGVALLMCGGLFVIVGACFPKVKGRVS